jgi:hypothetical protein
MGKTITAWEIPADVKAKYDSRGFYFDEDIKILDEVVNAVTRKEDAGI